MARIPPRKDLITLDADTIYGFVGSVLAKGFDGAVKTPKFHHEMWEMCTSKDKYVAIAAPRGHAKSTAITHSYVLASVLFRTKKYVIIISDTEEQAVEFLGDIRKELRENEALIDLFGIAGLDKDAETNVICRMNDGHRFRILAKGAEQKLRGRKWDGKRPDLIVCDDLENDESVMNKERRAKLRNWFSKAVVPSISRADGQIRVVGTILHLDSQLQRLIDNRAWTSKLYAAEDGNFENILWPEMFTPEDLKAIKQHYVEEGNPEGYSQEYLNRPVDVQNALFREEDLLPMKPEDANKRMVYYAAADFAIGEKESADYTAMIVGGMDEEGVLYIVDLRFGRWDSKEIIDEMISIQKRYDPSLFLVETAQIDKAIGPFLIDEMYRTGEFISIHKEVATKDKIARAQSISARVRSGGVRFKKDSEWFSDLQDQLLNTTRSGVKTKHDDLLDAFSWLGLAIHKFHVAPTAQEVIEEEWEEEFGDDEWGWGRCATTGY